MSAPLVRLTDFAAAPAEGVPPVLTGVGFAVAAGECVALVGPSGAGKTTLLRTIAGQLRPCAGSVGVDLARARIALISQRHDLVESLRVHTNVMAGALGRWSTARALRYLAWPLRSELAEAEQALAAVGLADKLKRRTAELSGGEQQRVAIARALVQAPRLLLADEPVASLDRAAAEQVLGLLTSLARERGMGLICSLHQLDLAERFCDRVLEVRSGALAERGA